MTQVTEREAFEIGFLFKLAQLKADPKDLNDVAFALEKTASVFIPAAIGAGIALPVLLKALFESGVMIPHTLGRAGGLAFADAQANANDISPEEAATEKIIGDYRRQIDMGKTRRNNEVASAIKSGKIDPAKIF